MTDTKALWEELCAVEAGDTGMLVGDLVVYNKLREHYQPPLSNDITVICVDEFAEDMVKKIKQNDDAKGVRGWLNLTFDELITLLDREVKELKANRSDPSECVDIANICMMYYDKLTSQHAAWKLNESGRGDKTIICEADREIIDGFRLLKKSGG